MARIRTVKPEFWGSPDVAALSVVSRLIFIGLWNLAEDNGVGLAHDRWVASQLFPMDEPGDAVENVRRAFAELSSGGQLDLFEVAGRRLYRLTGWRHQKIDKPNRNPRYYLPEEYGDQAVTCSDSPFAERSSNVPSAVADGSIPRARVKDQVPDQVKDPAPSELALVPAPAPTAPQNQATSAVTKRAQALATTYRDKVGSLANFVAVMKIAKAALEDAWPDDAVEAALLRLADDQRPVTKDSLRYELTGPPKTRRNARPTASDRANRTLAKLDAGEQGRVS